MVSGVACREWVRGGMSSLMPTLPTRSHALKPTKKSYYEMLVRNDPRQIKKGGGEFSYGEECFITKCIKIEMEGAY